jgi:RNA polymerase-associated protein CTR9
LADEARRRAEEQRKFPLERRKQEDKLKQAMQQEQHFEHVKEQQKHSSNSAVKRKDRSKHEDEDGESGKRRKDQKTKMTYEEEQEDHYRNGYATMTGSDKSGKAPDHLLAAAGLDDSDAKDETGHPQSAI